MAATVKDVAREAGVSIATVSYVLNGIDKSISEETQKRVLEAARRLDYIPNIAARSLATGRSNTIGLFFKGMGDIYSNPYFLEILGGIGVVVGERGYNLFLAAHDVQRADELNPVKYIRGNRIDGAILVWPPQNDDPGISEIDKENLPVVLVGQLPKLRSIDIVDADNVNGAYEATCHLLNLGHTRIGVVALPPTLAVGRDRLYGYRKALEERGIEFDEGLVSISERNDMAGFEAAARLLGRTERPSAILISSGTFVRGVLRYIKKRGLSIPGEVAVVSFDDEIQTDPPLTVVRLPVREIGTLAAKTLLERIEEPSRPVQRKLLRPRLVIRSSCGYGWRGY